MQALLSTYQSNVVDYRSESPAERRARLAQSGEGNYGGDASAETPPSYSSTPDSLSEHVPALPYQNTWEENILAAQEIKARQDEEALHPQSAYDKAVALIHRELKHRLDDLTAIVLSASALSRTIVRLQLQQKQWNIAECGTMQSMCEKIYALQSKPVAQRVRVVVVDAFVHEGLAEVVQNLKAFNLPSSRVFSVLLTNPRPDSGGKGVRLQAEGAPSINEAYEMGFDLVMDGVFDDSMARKITSIFLSNSAQWKHATATSTTSSNFLRIRTLLSDVTDRYYDERFAAALTKQPEDGRQIKVIGTNLDRVDPTLRLTAARARGAMEMADEAERAQHLQNGDSVAPSGSQTPETSLRLGSTSFRPETENTIETHPVYVKLLASYELALKGLKTRNAKIEELKGTIEERDTELSGMKEQVFTIKAELEGVMAELENKSEMDYSKERLEMQQKRLQDVKKIKSLETTLKFTKEKLERSELDGIERRKQLQRSDEKNRKIAKDLTATKKALTKEKKVIEMMQQRAAEATAGGAQHHHHPAPATPPPVKPKTKFEQRLDNVMDEAREIIEARETKRTLKWTRGFAKTLLELLRSHENDRMFAEDRDANVNPFELFTSGVADGNELSLISNQSSAGAARRRSTTIVAGVDPPSASQRRRSSVLAYPPFPPRRPSGAEDESVDASASDTMKPMHRTGTLPQLTARRASAAQNSMLSSPSAPQQTPPSQESPMVVLTPMAARTPPVGDADLAMGTSLEGSSASTETGKPKPKREVSVVQPEEDDVGSALDIDGALSEALNVMATVQQTVADSRRANDAGKEVPKGALAALLDSPATGNNNGAGKKDAPAAPKIADGEALDTSVPPTPRAESQKTAPRTPSKSTPRRRSQKRLSGATPNLLSPNSVPRTPKSPTPKKQQRRSVTATASVTPQPTPPAASVKPSLSALMAADKDATGPQTAKQKVRKVFTRLAIVAKFASAGKRAAARKGGVSPAPATGDDDEVSPQQRALNAIEQRLVQLTKTMGDEVDALRDAAKQQTEQQLAPLESLAAAVAELRVAYEKPMTQDRLKMLQKRRRQLEDTMESIQLQINDRDDDGSNAEMTSMVESLAADYSVAYRAHRLVSKDIAEITGAAAAAGKATRKSLETQLKTSIERFLRLRAAILAHGDLQTFSEQVLTILELSDELQKWIGADDPTTTIGIAEQGFMGKEDLRRALDAVAPGLAERSRKVDTVGSSIDTVESQVATIRALWRGENSKGGNKKSQQQQQGFQSVEDKSLSFSHSITNNSFERAAAASVSSAARFPAVSPLDSRLEASGNKLERVSKHTTQSVMSQITELLQSSTTAADEIVARGFDTRVFDEKVDLSFLEKLVSADGHSKVTSGAMDELYDAQHSQVLRLLRELRNRSNLTNVEIPDAVKLDQSLLKEKFGAGTKQQRRNIPLIMAADTALVARFADYYAEETAAMKRQALSRYQHQLASAQAAGMHEIGIQVAMVGQPSFNSRPNKSPLRSGSVSIASDPDVSEPQLTRHVPAAIAAPAAATPSPLPLKSDPSPADSRMRFGGAAPASMGFGRTPERTRVKPQPSVQQPTGSVTPRGTSQQEPRYVSPDGSMRENVHIPMDPSPTGIRSPSRRSSVSQVAVQENISPSRATSANTPAARYTAVRTPANVAEWTFGGEKVQKAEAPQMVGNAHNAPMLRTVLPVGAPPLFGFKRSSKPAPEKYENRSDLVAKISNSRVNTDQ